MEQKFSVGEVRNPLKKSVGFCSPKLSEVSIKFPSRLNAMALDPSLIDISEQGIYTPGEIFFSICIFKSVRVKLRDDSQVQVSERSPRKQLILHSALLMRDALELNQGFDIDVDSEDLRHCGLGSSGGLIASVAAAINEIYGCPISDIELITYLAQNHGEEIDGDSGHLQHVQCIGGSAASGLTSGGMVILAGNSVPIAKMDISPDHTVIIGIPNGFSPPDAEELMRLEIENMSKFIATGKKFREKIGYRVTHETLPSMVLGNLRLASKLIFDYRFDYGSIRNCSFVYPEVIRIAEKLRRLYERGLVDTLALSSVGPAFFAITKNTEECIALFEENDLRVLTSKISNERYIITKRKLYE